MNDTFVFSQMLKFNIPWIKSNIYGKKVFFDSYAIIKNKNNY